jgi:hypothetical protein
LKKEITLGIDLPPLCGLSITSTELVFGFLYAMQHWVVPKSIAINILKNYF